MTEAYWDEFGNSVIAGQCIGSGGEGEIRELLGDRRRVAKIYHPHSPLGSRHGAEAKLTAMAAAASEELRAIAAWPLSVIREKSDGRGCGFLMPRVDGREIHDLYQPKARAKHFPTADWKFLVYVARNLAAALEVLHNHRVVVGDFNQRNVRVTSDGLVTFVDCDSFQFQSATGARFPAAGVAVQEYTPPELQGRDLRDILRTPQHDSFALAVIIFQLLFLGRHPFLPARADAAESPSFASMIRDGTCLLEQPDPAVPPPGSRGIPRRVKSLFLDSLVADHGKARPAATDWRVAMEVLLLQLRRCDIDRGHVFFTGLENCPWCALRGAYDPFASVGLQQWLLEYRDEFGRQAKQFRERLNRLTAIPPVVRVPNFTASPRPLPTAVEDAFVKLKNASPWRLIPLSKETGAIRAEVGSRRWALESTTRQVVALCSEHELLRARAAASFEDLRRNADAELRALSELLEDLKRALAAKQAQQREEELREFLRGNRVADARNALQIPLVAVSMLERYAGIVTAADISEDCMRTKKIPKIGPRRKAALLRWRSRLEEDFRPRGLLPDVVLAAIKKEAMAKRASIENEIARIIGRGEALHKEHHRKFAELHKKIEIAAASTAQAKADWDWVASLESI
jgi:DNA-binding helix-hairpin-helix protein with protein kinase domain